MADRKVVTAKLVFVSPAGERIFHKQGRCSGKLCPFKRKPARAQPGRGAK